MIGLILAGGRASRFGGGDKGRTIVGGRSILDRLVATMRLQCESLVLNANGDPSRFADLALPVVADCLSGHPGPLAGVLAGLDHIAAHHPRAAFAVTVPADTPFVPIDLVARLVDRRVSDQAAIVCAGSGGRPHYTVALWSVHLRGDLRVALTAEDMRKVGAFVARHPFAIVDWPVEPYDPFFNINTPEDVAAAERIADDLFEAGS